MKLLTPFEKILNQSLQWDPVSLAALEPLVGKIIQVELQGLNMTISIFPDQQGVILLTDYEGPADVRVSAPPFTLLRQLLQSEQPLAQQKMLNIEGEVHTLQRFVHILKHLEIDWEEQCSRFLGDWPAHTLSRWHHQGQQYAQHQFSTLQRNWVEYLQEEVHYLPGQAEMQDFLNEVAILRDDVERLSQQIQRLMA